VRISDFCAEDLHATAYSDHRACLSVAHYGSIDLLGTHPEKVVGGLLTSGNDDDVCGGELVCRSAEL
jgi:hypothetical protein